jgi:serine/threonine protein kinase
MSPGILADVQRCDVDLQAGNVHLRIKDASILRAFEERELRDPSPRKAVGNDFIFESRDLHWDNNPGHPILCDFGEARYGKTTYTDPIQPSAYRSPEVIFGIPWTSSVDIWNLGVMVSPPLAAFLRRGSVD